MSIAYSTTQKRITFTAATRAELATRIKDGLLEAGWTVTDSGTDDYTLEHVATPSPALLQARVRLWDPGSGNCMRAYILNAAGTVVRSGSPAYLYPQGESWVLYANQYQFVVGPAVWPGNPGRKFLYVGTPYTPDFFFDGTPNECIDNMVLEGTGSNDGDTSSAGWWRDILHAGIAQTIWNLGGYMHAGGGNQGTPNLLAPLPPSWNNAYPYQWAVDDSRHAVDPLLTYSALAYYDNQECRIRGQLWDSILVAGGFDYGTEISFDGRTWVAMGHQTPGFGTNRQWTWFLLKEEPA